MTTPRDSDQHAKTTSFQEQVYAKLLEVPRGKVTTYGAIARALGTSPRAVGQALRRNPYAPRVPCHRVVASDGTVGGFMGETRGAPLTKKLALLAQEGVRVENDRVRDFVRVRFP